MLALAKRQKVRQKPKLLKNSRPSVLQRLRRISPKPSKQSSITKRNYNKIQQRAKMRRSEVRRLKISLKACPIPAKTKKRDKNF